MQFARYAVRFSVIVMIVYGSRDDDGGGGGGGGGDYGGDGGGGCGRLMCILRLLSFSRVHHVPPIAKHYFTENFQRSTICICHLKRKDTSVI